MVRPLPKCPPLWVFFCCVIGVLPSLAQPGPKKVSSSTVETLKLIYLDTRALDQQARSGQPVVLPFELPTGELVDKTLHLRSINLRAADFPGAALKDGVAGRGRFVPLPSPATYQGFLGTRGSAALTITDQAVEGHFLDSDGWSVIEPLEPLIRLLGLQVPGVEQSSGEKVVEMGLLGRVNHVIYNATTRGLPPTVGHLAAGVSPPCLAEDAELDECTADSAAIAKSAIAKSRGKADRQRLRMQVVLDGDPEFYRIFSEGSTFPFWRKQEGMLNTLDWMLNCLEPEADAGNDWAFCANAFDGGHDAFRVRVEIAGLEAWVSGGPDAHDRDGLLQQSIRATHQADPPCCGPPHSAGRADLVVFLSGRALAGGAGLAAGVAGLSIYDNALCQAQEPCCHHAVSQMAANENLDGGAYQQLVLFAHEIGHVLGGPEDPIGITMPWLDQNFFGRPLMYSNLGFFPGWTLLYSEIDATQRISPVLHQRLRPIGDSAKK